MSHMLEEQSEVCVAGVEGTRESMAENDVAVSCGCVTNYNEID